MIGGARRRRIVAHGAAVLLAGTLSCDPCAGIAGCTAENPQIGVLGRILDENDGSPVSGATIDFVRTEGPTLDADSIRVTTDEDGTFFIQAKAEAAGIVRGHFVVTTTAGSYRVLDHAIPTSFRGGEAQVLRPWSTVPALPDFAEIRVRGVPSVLATNAPVEFRRSGGIQVSGLDGDFFRTSTDSRGWMPLFGNQVRPLAVGDVEGELTVSMPYGVVRGEVRIPATADFRTGARLRQFVIGPSLEYHIEVNRRGSYGAHIQGVEIRFQRTSGIAIDPTSWVGVTDAGGRAVFMGRALEEGTVTGTLSVVPPAPWRSFERNAVSFSTFDADGAILHTVIEIGPGVAAYIELTANGAPVVDATVEFERTSGIALTPAKFSARTDSTGLAFLGSTSTVEGEVVGTVRVTPPAPYAPFAVTNVRLVAFDGDAPAVKQVVATWDVTQPPSSAVRE